MSLILNIDTALDSASVCVAENGLPLQALSNTEQRDHAAWIHHAIENILGAANKELKDLDAVAVSNGPGSYTGLRIGLSTAKGLCYALNIPLITVPTVEIMAYSVKDEEGDLIIPLIDARRNEVFTAVYDKQIRVKNSTYALIIQPDSFKDLLSESIIIFCGNGVEKTKKIIVHENARYSSLPTDARHLSALSRQYYLEKSFADLAYSEPFYIKDFHTTVR